MRETNPKRNPWQAIPAPPATPKVVTAEKLEFHKQAEMPVDRGNVSNDHPEYTAAQIDRIKEGIKAGRAAMEKRGNYAMVFADAFCKAGGFQVPGFSQVSDAHLRVLGSILLMWLEGPDYSLLRNWRWINEAMTDALHREVNRTLQEVAMFGASNHPDAYAWRFIPSPNSVDKEACRRLAECDNYGLGIGLFPLDELLVFQPIYDRAYLELVYRDEVLQARNSASVLLAAESVMPSRKGVSVGWIILTGLIMFAIGYLIGNK